MDFTQYTFAYTPANLRAFSYVFSLDHIFVFAGIIALIIAYIGAYILIPYITGYFILQNKEQTKQDKRRVIQDLILMKEIQGELEKEMEQALLNTAMLQNTNPQT